MRRIIKKYKEGGGREGGETEVGEVDKKVSQLQFTGAEVSSAERVM